jgi:serine/threonine-protein kinase
LQVESLHAALSHAPGLPEARSRLAEIFHDTWRAAEATGDGPAAAQAELRLRTYDDGRYARILEGRARLGLVLDPPDATVRVLRYRPTMRRLVAEPVGEPLHGPVIAVDLAWGSYLLVADAPGRATTRLPVWLDRGGSGPAPRAEGPFRLWLPPADQLGGDEVYVPPGWTRVGEQSPREEELPVQRVWVDGFAIQRHPVTNTDWIRFLDALVAEGADAEAFCPRTEDSGDRRGSALYGRTADGRFELVPDADGDLWDPAWPVFYIAAEDIPAYAAWRGRGGRSGWRAPHEWEWEKAARGPDVRRFPWGDGFDASFCACREASAGRAHPYPVGHFETDLSPYAVADMAGGATEICGNRYRREGPPLGPDGRFEPDLAGPGDYHAARGGAWDYVGASCQVTRRYFRRANSRRGQTSFRLVRALSPDHP